MPLCLVDGAGGFIGSHVAERLLEEGYEVRATDLPRADLSWLESKGAKTVKADLLSRGQIKPLFKDIDRVFHIAGLFDFALPYGTLYDANVVATQNMCEAALKAGVDSFVHWSTVGVYGYTKYTPIDEDHPKNPTNNYEATKWLGEQLAIRYHEERGLPVIAIRPTLVYGPKSRYGLALFLSAATALYGKKKKAPIRIVSDILTHNVHADDVAGAAVHLTKRKKEAVGRAFNIADEKPVTVTEMFNLIAESLEMEMGAPLPLLKRFIPYTLAMTAPIAPLLDKMISMTINLLTKVVSQKWKGLEKEFHVKDALCPRIERDWITYGAAHISKLKWIPAGDKVYDISALKSTGYKFMWPDFREGVKKTVEWYKENGWLPKR